MVVGRIRVLCFLFPRNPFIQILCAVGQRESSLGLRVVSETLHGGNALDKLNNLGHTGSTPADQPTEKFFLRLRPSKKKKP